MEHKIETPLKKIGGSYYALIPSGAVSEMGIEDDKTILVEFEKVKNIVKEKCLAFYKSNEEVTLTTNDKTLIGVVLEVDKSSISFKSNNETFIISMTDIIELNNEVLNE